MKKTMAIIGKCILGILIVILVAVLAYVAYVFIQYYRIDDNLPLEVHNAQTRQIETGTPYSVATYNIGFGAYDPQFTFFMDSGYMLDGTLVQGTQGTATSRQAVLDNTDGAILTLKSLDPDFILLQEVDVDSTRSYHVDQAAMVAQAFPDMGYTFAENFHSAWLAYPFNDPHGKSLAGLLTLGNYDLGGSIRRQYPVDDGIPHRFTDLDRGFSVSNIPVQGGKTLVLINSHMSAYDEGGTIRSQQLQLLGEVAAKAYDKGSYVIIGGDFNHELGKDSHIPFPSQQQFPSWVSTLTNADLPTGLRIVTADNARWVATCRSAEIPYVQCINFETIVDGFIVSDNIQAQARNIDTGYAFSDHQPVLMTFTLLP